MPQAGTAQVLRLQHPSRSTLLLLKVQFLFIFMAFVFRLQETCFQYGCTRYHVRLLVGYCYCDGSLTYALKFRSPPRMLLLGSRIAPCCTSFAFRLQVSGLATHAPCQGFGFGHLACACTVLQVFQSPWLHLCGLLFAARFLGSPLGNPFSFQGVAIRHYFSGVRLRQCMHAPAVRFATSAVCQCQGFGFRHSALFVL